MNRINLGNRYGEERVLVQVKSGLYSTSGFKKVGFIRVQPTEKENEYSFIDFDGSSIITTGSKLPTGEVITSIVYQDNVYLIKTNLYDEGNNLNKPQGRDSIKQEQSGDSYKIIPSEPESNVGT